MNCKKGRSCWVVACVVCAILVSAVGVGAQESTERDEAASRAEVMVRRARNQVLAGDYVKASEFFIASLKIKDSDAVRKELVGVLIKDGRAQEAEKWLGDLVYTDDRMAAWLVGGYRTERSLVDAKRLLEAILEKKEDGFQFRVMLAEVLSARQEYDQCIASYQQLIREKPEDDKLFLAYLTVLFWANRYDDYLKDSSEYLEREPKNLDLRSRRLDLLMGKNEFGLAIQECQGILELQPDSKAFCMRLAQILSWDGRYAESEKAYEELLAAHPDDPVLARGLGEVRVWAMKYEEAVEPLKAALKSKPKDPQVQRLLTMCLSEVKTISKPDQKWLADIAAEYVAAEKVRSDIPFYTSLARALRKLEQHDLAIKVLRRTLENRPKSRSVRLQLADTLSAAGKFQEAEEEYDLLLQETQQPRKETP